MQVQRKNNNVYIVDFSLRMTLVVAAATAAAVTMFAAVKKPISS